AVSRRKLRRRDRRLRREERRGSSCRPGRAAPDPASRRAAGHPRDHETARTPRALLPVLVRRSGAAPWQSATGWARLHVSAGERSPLSRARGAGGADRKGRLPRGAGPVVRRRDRGAPHGGGSLSALAEIRAAPGLDAYLEELEERLERAVGVYHGVLAEVGAEALAAGGKRLRPLLVYLSTPLDARPPV